MMNFLLFIMISLLIALNGIKTNSYPKNNSKYISCIQLKQRVPGLNLQCEDLIESFRHRSIKKVNKDDEEKLKQMLQELKFN